MVIQARDHAENIKRDSIAKALMLDGPNGGAFKGAIS
jgi:hypothetical protein